MKKVSSSEQATARAIVERMREAAKVKTFGQLGKLLNGISSQAISKAITAGSIPQHWYDVIELKTGVCRNQICHGLQTVTAALDGRYDIKEEEMVAKKRHRGGSDLVPLVAVPLLGRVPAGIPEQIEEQVEDYVAFPGVAQGTYALRAHGESMVPAIRHDDFVLFRIDQDARPGQVVVVNNEFGESMLKRLREKDGELWLTSDNPEYPAVRPNAHYRIMGVVVRVIRDIPF